ncbi:MAG: hypothetical protein ACKVJG_18010 [Candidatus Latescibacterota bacterium]|jgi:uncharacterized protein (DUF342 family)
MADTTNGELQRLLSHFGMSRIDVSQVRNRITAAIGPQRRLLAKKAHRLGEVVQLYQKIMTQRTTLEKRISSRANSTKIRVHNYAYPGVEIRLGEFKNLLKEKISAPCFQIRNDQLVTF